MAPIDIVIDLIKRHKSDIDMIPEGNRSEYGKGALAAYNVIINELEGFKKLFN